MSIGFNSYLPNERQSEVAEQLKMFKSQFREVNPLEYYVAKEFVVTCR